MFSIVNRYVAKMFIGFFAATLVVMTSMYVVIEATSTLMKLQPSMTSLIQYYSYGLPAVVYQMLPMAALTASIFTLSTMNKSNELVALFSAGFSLTRIAMPILVFSFAISVGGFWLSDSTLPMLNQKKNYVYFVDIKKQPSLYSTVKTNKIWYRSKNIILNMQTLNAEQAKAQGVTFYYFDQAWNLVQLISAKDLVMKGSEWELTDGTITLFAEESIFPLTQTFKHKTVTIHEDTFDLTATSNSSNVMSVEELRSFIRKNKAAGLDTLRYEVDYQAKYGFALATFVMAFLGVPFSVSFNRGGGRALNLAICMGLAFSYWILYSVGLTTGRHGILPPVIAAWLPNVIMTGITTVFLLRLKK